MTIDDKARKLLMEVWVDMSSFYLRTADYIEDAERGDVEEMAEKIIRGTDS